MDPRPAHQGDRAAGSGQNSHWLRIDVTAHPGSAMVRLCLAGELDRMTAEQLQQLVIQVLDGEAPATLELDAADLSFLDSSGIRSLLACRRSAEASGSRLVVTNPARIPYQVLEITGLLEHFAVAPDAARAVTAGGPRRNLERPTSTTPPNLQQLVEQAEQIRQAAGATRERARAISRAYPPWPGR
ncbi:STAS domain-containing protein [Actinoplanes sp. GCM10030250]|uniref:STAS domain-containing protein n=1 Tax=Actinoplanes sp. GCM10030250 TaxID=3273376 RepID=UPI00360FEDB5